MPIKIKMRIEFKYFGRHVGTRFAGRSMREKISISLKQSEHLILDFAGVESISGLFAAECFGKLVDDFDIESISTKSVYLNTSPQIKSVIVNAYRERLNKPNRSVYFLEEH